METKPPRSEDDAEKDDDEDEKETTQTRRTVRAAAPLVKVETENNKETTKSKTSLGESLLKQLRVQREQTAEADKPKDDTLESKEASDEQGETHESEELDDTSTTTPEETSVEADEPEAADATEISAPAPLEAANWEPEGELNDEGEISLTPPAEAKEPENKDEFADLPPAPEHEDEAPEVDNGPVEPELLEAGLGAEGPPEPPEDEPPEPAEDEPEEPARRIVAPGAAVSAVERTSWYDAAAADKERQRELNEAEYQGAKRGHRSGLGAGLLFGWLLGRHGKKKQARNFENQLGSKDKQIKGLKNEQQTAQTRVEAIKRTQESLQTHMAEMSAKAANAPENKPGVLAEVRELAHVGATTAEQQTKTLSAAENLTAERQRPPLTRSVIEGQMSAAAVEGTLARPEVQKDVERQTKPEERAITEETYKTPEGRRVETSAWHRIEVDAKTGKAVEDPEVAYGEEFKREKRQEVLRKDAAQTTGGATGVASQLGGLAASSASSPAASSSHGRFVPGRPPTPQDSPYGKKPGGTTEQPHASNEILRYASMPIIWITAIIIVVVLFAFGVLR
jgi:hypothetical protein